MCTGKGVCEEICFVDFAKHKSVFYIADER